MCRVVGSLVALALVAGGCGAQATDDERAVCEALTSLEAATGSERIQAARAELSAAARRAGNPSLEVASAQFEAAVADGDVGEAGAAIGTMREECTDLGVGP